MARAVALSFAALAVEGFAKSTANACLRRMFKAFEFCIQTTGTKAGQEWLHEIKYDGFRLRVERAQSSKEIQNRTMILIAVG
jgi:ATP-dependent DNA ligase